jgi:hypothetical protein
MRKINKKAILDAVIIKDNRNKVVKYNLRFFIKMDVLKNKKLWATTIM